MTTSSVTSDERFFGSRLHVAFCLAWFTGVFLIVYHYMGFSFFLIVTLPIGMLSLIVSHALFFALRYVLTGRTPNVL